MRLFPKRNSTKPKLYDQGILIRFLKQSMSQFIKNLHGTSNHLKDLFLQNLFVAIRGSSNQFFAASSDFQCLRRSFGDL